MRITTGDAMLGPARAVSATVPHRDSPLEVWGAGLCLYYMLTGTSRRVREAIARNKKLLSALLLVARSY